MIKKFDPKKLLVPLKFMSLGCTLVTEKLLHMSTPQFYNCCTMSATFTYDGMIETTQRYFKGRM